MYEAHVEHISQRARTGSLPSADEVRRLLDEAYQRYRRVDDGVVADYIPILGEADPAWFGLSLVGVNGAVHELGDTGVAFSIQSISKAFVFALVREEYGHEVLHEAVARYQVQDVRLEHEAVHQQQRDGSPSGVGAG